jgi:hypothetical protein
MFILNARYICSEIKGIFFSQDYLQKGPKKEDLLPTTSSGPETHVLNYLVSSGWITAS